MELRGHRIAPGHPGLGIGWAPSAKDGFGTAYSADSRLWYTLWKGMLTEVYFPTIDRPQLRGAGFIVTDGESFVHDELRHMRTKVEQGHPRALDYRVVSEDPEGRYVIDKEVIAAPHNSCVLMRVRFRILRDEFRDKLHLFVVAIPHLDVEAGGTDAGVHEMLGRPILTAHRKDVALAMGASVPFSRATVGYLGRSDGIRDLSENMALDDDFDLAPDGNVALTGEIPVAEDADFVLGIAFGESLEAASTALLQSLGTSFPHQSAKFVEQWERSARKGVELGHVGQDGGHLFRVSRAILLAHEDKTFPGAFIASPSTPWGWARGFDRGGYHLVWTRDMVQTATALIAVGNREGPLRSLMYLASRQRGDGGFPQNFWVNGQPYWNAVQLDEVAYPIILAWRLRHERALEQFDPYPMVLRAARFLLNHGPVTQQERWEEASGFSPSTLAVQIAALTCASGFATARGDDVAARLLQENADFLECHIEAWTVTQHGTLDPATPRHYVRIRPAASDDPTPNEGPDFGELRIHNLAPGTRDLFPAQEIVSTEFLELVRYGIRPPDDPIVLETLGLVDRILKVDTPFGPVWHRYNHDGYGQGPGGAAYQGTGVGRPWPLLTGERGHFELAAGRDPLPYVRAMERFATPTGLITEQVWDEPDRVDADLFFGRPTGAAMPLAWAHAEYIRLLRSVQDGEVFDRLPAVADRYLGGHTHRHPMEVWKFNRQPRTVPAEWPLRIQVGAPFRLHWSGDDWRTTHDADSLPTALALDYVDLPPLDRTGRSYRFTFYWPAVDRWEERDYRVDAR